MLCEGEWQGDDAAAVCRLASRATVRIAGDDAASEARGDDWEVVEGSSPMGLATRRTGLRVVKIDEADTARRMAADPAEKESPLAEMPGPAPFSAETVRSTSIIAVAADEVL